MGKQNQFELAIGSGYKIASLFSGCGGLDLGFCGEFKFRKQSFGKNNSHIVFSNDFDPDACSVYNNNINYFGGHPISFGDIRDVPSSSIPEFDILLAGFPCQPFSNAGHRQGLEDKKGRGTLFEECERILSFAVHNNSQKPKAFVFENVRGITSTKMPNSDVLVTTEICSRMEKLGYTTKFKLLKLSNYGVPQNRYRVFFVGVLRDEFDDFNFDTLDELVSSHGLPSADYGDDYDLLLGSVLCDIPKGSPQVDTHWHYSPTTQGMVDNIGPCLFSPQILNSFKRRKPLDKMLQNIKKGRSWKNINPDDLPKRFRKIHDDPVKYRAPNFYRRFALGEINGTITASAQPENCGITHPGENRRFSIREVARIQSFPDDFNFETKHPSLGYKVIGNAVPPVFGWILAKGLLNHLEK